jgi:hypothetical protein
MKRLCAGIIVVAAIVAGVQPAGAGESIEVSGDFAPGGTVTVSGNLCQGTNQLDQPVPGQVTVTIVGGQPPANVGFANTGTDLDGDWSVQITISDSAQPGEQYTVGAGCTRLSVGEPVSFEYPDVLLVMGQPITPTTPTTETPPATDSVPEGDEGGGEGAAAAATSPRFTG